jgi:NADPH:quinone reductase-like Zn-dependent oxidoreductase
MPVDILGGCSDRSLPTPAITEGSIRSRVTKVGFNEADTLIASNIYAISLVGTKFPVGLGQV